MAAVLTVSTASLFTVWWLGYTGHLAVVGPDKVSRLHGLTADAVFADLGPPARECEFAIGDRDAWVEFRIELHNFYPPSDPQSAFVRIRECQWDYPGHHLAVWFHQVDGQWVALDTCQWPEGVVF